jgi:hypothetical protein
MKIKNIGIIGGALMGLQVINRGESNNKYRYKNINNLKDIKIKIVDLNEVLNESNRVITEKEN